MYATVLLALRTKKTYPNYQPQKQIVKMIIKLKFRSEPMTDVPPHGTSVKLTQTLNSTFRLSRKFNNLHATCQSQFLRRLGATFTSQKVLFPHKIMKYLILVTIILPANWAPPPDNSEVKRRLNYNGTISSINFDQVPIRIYPDKVNIKSASTYKGLQRLMLWP